MLAAKVFNKREGRYCVLDTENKSTEVIYRDFNLLERRLKTYVAFYGMFRDTKDLEVHVFDMELRLRLKADSFWARGDL